MTTLTDVANLLDRLCVEVHSYEHCQLEHDHHAAANTGDECVPDNITLGEN